MKKERTITGEQMFNALHLAVDALANEEPGGATTDDIRAVIEAVIECAEILLNARNRLRAAKGLPPLDLNSP